MSALEKYPNDPNRGVNLKVWFTSIVVALLILIVLAYFFLLSAGKKDVPKANQPHPSSRLVMPMQNAPIDVAQVQL